MPHDRHSPGWTETDRLGALRSYGILDTPPEADFDDLTRLAAGICAAPIALVSLVDEARQWFKSQQGLGDVRQTPRRLAVCDHAMRGDGLLVVPDLAADPRFAGNDLVFGPPHLRFYAGAPLRTPDGMPLGSLCVLDREARPHGLAPGQAEALAILARQVMAQLELRRLLALQARERHRLELLNRAGARLAAELDPGRLARAAADAATELAEAAYGAFRGTVAAAEGGAAQLAALAGAQQDVFADLAMPDAAAGGAPALAGGGLVRSDDVAADARLAPLLARGAAGGPALRSYLAVPVVSRLGAVLGGLFVGDPEPARFTDGHEAALTALATQVAAAIDNACLYQAAQREAAVRREAEESTRASAARLTEVLESIGDAFYAIDDAGRFTYANRRACEVWGLEPGTEIIGRHLTEVFPQVADTQSWRLHLSVLREGRPQHAEIASAISGRLLQASLYPVAGGGVAVYFRDVTEAREQELRLRAITEAMPQIVWSTRPDGYHDYYNERWYDFTGTRPGEADGEGWASLFHPDDCEQAWQRWRHSLATGVPYEVEYRLRRADGAWRWFLGRAVPVRDPGTGAIQRWYGTCTDIEDAVRARETLRRSAAELERMVAERTQALEDANARLRAEARERGQVEAQLRQAQKMEAVGQLTGGIAHDFNNLLTGIAGSLELIRTRTAQGRHAEVERFAQSAAAAAGSAAGLTHRLLAFARRQTLDPKPTDVNRLVTGMEDLVRRTVGEAIRVETALAARLWRTLCDAHQLESALLNLVINARDAMPGGGALTLQTGNACLGEADVAGLPGLRPGEYVCLAVTDTGTGMSPETMEKVFEPFFTTKTPGQGTGLGLSMVYGFVRQSGGQVELRSELGRGTTVRLFLPRYLHGAAEDAGEVTAASLGDAPRAGAGETVLIAEDDPTVRMLVREVLVELGYVGHEASDGAAALRILDSAARVDLLVTDVGLPGMNGRMLADAARRLRPGLRVLFITGYAHDAALGQGVLEPGMHLLTKPFALSALAAKLRELLGPPGAAPDTGPDA